MATITPAGLTPLSKSYGSASAGQAAGAVAAAGGGDTVPLIGAKVLLTFRTTGTASTITLDSVAPSSYGADGNITVTMGATDEQDVLIEVDERFKQTSGNIGNLNLSYTSAVGLTVKAKYIP